MGISGEPVVTGEEAMSTLQDPIDVIREGYGRKLLILGHHYQRSNVLRHADEIGDSLELSRKAASHPEAERIVFCGVRFMAESADVLTGPEQTVYMPVPGAGCPMANMATAAAAETAWEQLGGAEAEWVPIVYVNSMAELKAFCGARGGSTCTSSNAARVFEWALSQGKRILFLPDEHLGRNTAHDLGLADADVALYDPADSDVGEGGGDATSSCGQAKVVVWKGFCLVHAAFTVAQVMETRRVMSKARIIVHPEAPKDVVRAADAHGSTAQIIKYVEAAPAGSTVVIGTEQNLVERLACVHAGRVTVKALHPSVCANMSKTSEQSLLELLRDWPDVCRVEVAEAARVDARAALSRMLEV